MNRIIYFVIITCFLASCKDDSYTEGSITTYGAKEITMESVVLNGNIKFVVSGNNSKIARRGFVYGIDANELTAVKGDQSGMVYDETGGEGNFSGNVNDLLPNTKYYAKAFFVLVQSDTKGQVVYYDEQNKLVYLYDGSIDWHDSYCDVFVFYGNTIEFKTENGVKPPVVTTQAESNVTASGARLHGTIVNIGYPGYSERGFVYGTSQNPTVENTKKIVATGSGTAGIFYADITGLTVNTLYYFRAYAINNEVPKYGEQRTFTPKAVLPSVITLSATNVAANTATLNGELEYPGDPPCTERGFVYSSSFQNPSVNDDASVTKKIVITGGAFSANISGLTAETTYYVRAYASNSEGIAYGQTVSFKYTTVVDYVVLTSHNIAVQKTDLSSGTDWTSAQALCKASRVGGFSDWRLPTIGELSALYTNRTTIGGFSTTYYWSSTVYNAGISSYCYSFNSGGQTSDSNSNSHRVRAVRTLP